MQNVEDTASVIANYQIIKKHCNQICVINDYL